MVSPLPGFTEGVCNKEASKRQGSMHATQLQAPLLQTRLGTRLHISPALAPELVPGKILEPSDWSANMSRAG